MSDFNSDMELEFVDDDGNQIKGGPEQVTYIDEKGEHISAEKAKKMILSGKYVDDRTLYSKRAAKRYQKAAHKQPHRQAKVEYVPPNPNQTNELIANMHEIFAKARSNIKEMTDLQMIEEDATTTNYDTYRKKSSRRDRDRSYKSRYENNYTKSSNRSKSQMVQPQYQKSMSKVKSYHRSDSQKRSEKSKQLATAYNPYTGQYYQYEVPANNQEQEEKSTESPSYDDNYYQQNSSSSRQKKSKAEKAAEIDAKIAKLQAKLAKTNVGNSSSSRGRSMHPRIERGERPTSPKMVSPTPPTYTIDKTTMEYRMHHYSGIEDPRTNLLRAEMLAKENRERIKLERAYNEVLEERYNQRRIQSIEPSRNF